MLFFSVPMQSESPETSLSAPPSSWDHVSRWQFRGELGLSISPSPTASSAAVFALQQSAQAETLQTRLSGGVNVATPSTINAKQSHFQSESERLLCNSQ